MPDAEGILTAEDGEKINRWWIGRWKGSVACVVCQTSNWYVSKHLVQLPRFATDAFINGTSTYPHVLIVCHECSHTMLFNAVRMGIVEEAAESNVPSFPPGKSSNG
jgi:hypothetical protein